MAKEPLRLYAKDWVQWFGKILKIYNGPWRQIVVSLAGPWSNKIDEQIQQREWNFMPLTLMPSFSRGKLPMTGIVWEFVAYNGVMKKPWLFGLYWRLYELPTNMEIVFKPLQDRNYARVWWKRTSLCFFNCSIEPRKKTRPCFLWNTGYFDRDPYI